MPKTHAAKAQDQASSSGAAMIVESIPIADLHLDPANARKHPARSLDALRASLTRFGQVKPIVVDSRGVVRAGNGTLEAARALGWRTINAIRSDLPAVELTAYAVADNRIADLSEFDPDVLASTLMALQADDFDLDAIGFTDAEVDAMFGGDQATPGDEHEEAESSDDDWNPAIRYELVFDDVAQQDRWFGFMRWLKGREDFRADTMAGRIDAFLRSCDLAALVPPQS